MKAEFWSVKPGIGIGPLAIGDDYDQVVRVLREQGLEPDTSQMLKANLVSIPGLGIQLVFSQSNPSSLKRIDIVDDRLRFGSLAVVGKRAHEIVGLFKVPKKERVWSSVDNEHDHTGSTSSGSTADSRDLLAHGTIWITSIGLGLTLNEGLVATVHLCDSADAPTVGMGLWTKEQQRLSEVREIPPSSFANGSRRQRSSSPSKIAMIPFLLAILVAAIVWWTTR